MARSLTIPVGAETTIPITLANLGSKTWVAGGSNPVRLTYHLLNNSRQVITWDGLRTYLPYDIAPGKSLTLNAAVKAPSTPGAYILLFDLVEEGVTWFQFQGSPVIDVGLSAPPNYSASIMVRYIPTLKAGQEVSASVLLTNTGSKKWASSGNNPVVLTYHWLDTAGGVIVWDGLRTSFPQDVASSDNILLQAKIKAPPQAGAYSLLFDLVEEGVTWFQAQGSTVWEAQVVVLP